MSVLLQICGILSEYLFLREPLESCFCILFGVSIICPKTVKSIHKIQFVPSVSKRGLMPPFTTTRHNLIDQAFLLTFIIKLMKTIMMNCFVEWLTNKVYQVLIQFQLGPLSDVPIKAPTRHDQGLNLHRTCLQTSLNEVAQQ